MKRLELDHLTGSFFKKPSGITFGDIVVDAPCFVSSDIASHHRMTTEADIQRIRLLYWYALDVPLVPCILDIFTQYFTPILLEQYARTRVSAGDA